MVQSSAMGEPTTFLSLPPELRTIVYEYVALFHKSHRIGLDQKSLYTTTSGLVGVNRLISSEYPDASWTAVTELNFTVQDLNFTHVLRWFRKLGKTHIASLQHSEAAIYVSLTFTRPCDNDIDKLGRWLAFCADLGGMTVAYECTNFEQDSFCADGVSEFLRMADPYLAAPSMAMIYKAVVSAKDWHEEWRIDEAHKKQLRIRAMRRMKYYSSYGMW